MRQVEIQLPEIVDRLSEHRLLKVAPQEELEWLAGLSTMVVLEPGEMLIEEGQTVHRMWILLSGHISFYGGRGAIRGKLMDWYGGDIVGALPYSRLKASPGDAVVEESLEALVVAREHFPEMVRVAPTVTTVLVHVMLDRARQFTTEYLHDAKMASLGKLSAGLAHELNNPASAAARSAKLLTSALADACAAARSLGGAGLTDEQDAAVVQLQQGSLGATTRLWSALDFGDREDDFERWLEEHDADGRFAAALAETALTTADLDELAQKLTPVQLEAAVHWIAAQHSARVLTIELERSAARIHDLVSAVKRFTYMDRVTDAERLSIGHGIADTVTVLASKTRAKAAIVRLDLPPDLPEVRALGGELNQVWHNLLDNALDAVSNGGTVEVRAFTRRDQVVVEIRDNGSGVPDDIKGRVFDPFFTTKPAGFGTGLGLDIARRIVARHDGDIELESEPGRTIFRVVLPAAPA